MLSRFNHYLLLFVSAIFVHQGGMAQSDAAPLVTEVQVTKGDSVFKSTYIYTEKQKSLETKYVKSGDFWTRYEMNEWAYTNKWCSNFYKKRWLNNQWVQTYQINFDYIGDLLQTETHFVFNDGTPSFESKISYKYLNNQLNYTLSYLWNGSLWQLDTKTTYHYNANGLQDTITFAQYQNNKLNSAFRSVYVYRDDSQVSSLTYQSLQDAVWKDDFKTEYNYDMVSNRLNYEIQKNWDSVSNRWVNEQNVSYIFNSEGKLIKEIYQRWAIQYWKNVLRYDYAYNENGKLTAKTINLPVYEDFRPQFSVAYSDFQHEKPTQIAATYDFWGGVAGDSVNAYLPYYLNDEIAVAYGSKVKISYIPTDDTKIATIIGNGKGELYIYPNPSKGVFYFDPVKNNVISWCVTDITGKHILISSRQTYSGAIDLNDYNDGIYILQAKNPTGILSQKLIKK